MQLFGWLYPFSFLLVGTQAHFSILTMAKKAPVDPLKLKVAQLRHCHLAMAHRSCPPPQLVGERDPHVRPLAVLWHRQHPRRLLGGFPHRGEAVRGHVVAVGRQKLGEGVREEIHEERVMHKEAPVMG